MKFGLRPERKVGVKQRKRRQQTRQRKQDVRRDGNTWPALRNRMAASSTGCSGGPSRDGEALNQVRTTWLSLKNAGSRPHSRPTESESPKGWAQERAVSLPKYFYFEKYQTSGEIARKDKEHLNILHLNVLTVSILAYLHFSSSIFCPLFSMYPLRIRTFSSITTLPSSYPEY